MKKTIIASLVVFSLVTLAGSAMAASWTIESHTKTVDDYVKGNVNSGVFHYSIDNTGVDPWNHFEVTKIGRTASWEKGFVFTHTDYKCPGVSSTNKYGKAYAENMVQTFKNGNSGYFKENFNANFAHLQKSGNYFNYGYGTELKAEGKYSMYTTMGDAKPNPHFGFHYSMSGKGSGDIRYGSAVFTAGANWAPDKHGSMYLNRWEYNDASATGKGSFEEHLYGKDMLKNFKYSLPGGGSIDTIVSFTDGMDATPIWMYAN